MRPILLAAALLALSAATAGAQVVRGQVREQGSAAPVPGAVVSLLRADAAPTAAPVVSALSDDRGAFSVRAPAAGRYVLRIKRIGVRQTLSEPFDLAVGETRAAELDVTPLPAVQPEVRVTGRTQCRVRGQGHDVLAALWEDASAALAALSLSRPSRGFQGTVTRFTRELEPHTGKVTVETKQVRSGYAERPFRSAPADFLADRGYVQLEPDNTVSYFAPDAEVLLSEVFLRSHCFQLELGDGDDFGLVGLAFRPVRRPRLPDVQGTLWIHLRSRELRRIDVRYTHLPNNRHPGRAGATVHLARLPAGSWIVSQWAIRMPIFVQVHGRNFDGSLFTRDSVTSVREEGGVVEFEKPI